MKWLDSLYRHFGFIPKSEIEELKDQMFSDLKQENKDLTQRALDLTQENNNLIKRDSELTQNNLDLKYTYEFFKRSIDELLQEVKDGENLGNMMYEDKEATEKELIELQLKYEGIGTIDRKLSELSKDEIGVLLGYIPLKSDKSIKDKINYKQNHSDPKNTKQFLKKVARCEYVDGIFLISQTRSIRKTSFNKISKENGTYVIRGVYFNKFGKVFGINTTAKNEREANYVKDFLNENF
tara:strand:- start:656 stop:1369 length:714 start_codon:yes stop_codon:yes gene_type:complete